MSQLQLPQDFLKKFIEKIDQSRARVWLQAMVIESGETVDVVAEHLKAASKRGVDVRIYYDWVTKRYLHGDIRLTPTFNSSILQQERVQHKRNVELWNSLENCGVRVIEMNRPPLGQHIFPVMGRNHIKIYVADNTVWMGGLNFFESSFRNIDFVVQFDEPEMTSALVNQIQMVNASRVSHDYIREVGSNGTLVVDAGKQGESLIYSEALKMVSKAHSEIIFVSQLVPENRMLDLLMNKAEDGVKISIYTSHPTDSTFTRYPLKYFYTVFRKELKKAGLPMTFIHLDRKIHAKLIVVDGVEAMFGSHNFVESGVQMGTQEISLRTDNTILVDQLRTFISSLAQYIPV